MKKIRFNDGTYATVNNEEYKIIEETVTKIVKQSSLCSAEKYDTLSIETLVLPWQIKSDIFKKIMKG